MLDNDPNNSDNSAAEEAPGSHPAETPPPGASDTPGTDAGESAANPGMTAPETPTETPTEKPAKKAAAKRAAKAPAKKAAPRKTAAKKAAKAPADGSDPSVLEQDVAEEKPKKKAATRKRAAKSAPAAESSDETATAGGETQAQGEATLDSDSSAAAATGAAPMVLFQAPEPTSPPARKRTTRKVAAAKAESPAPDGSESAQDVALEAGEGKETPTTPGDDGAAEQSAGRGRGRGQGRGGQGRRSGQGDRDGDAPAAEDSDEAPDTDEQDDSEDTGDGEGGARRRRRRGGRRRRKPSDGEAGDGSEESEDTEDTGDSAETTDAAETDADDDNEAGGSRRRRRRRRPGEDGNGAGEAEKPARARRPRNPEDEITSIGGSTRLEAKKQRRREGREAGRRRAPIVSEAEFLARRESVDRVMVIRQRDDLTQIGVLEDKVLVEHYVARESQTSLIGNVYLGRVQNVLPSMEAAFIDIGKGRNAVLYAGEVNWAAVGHKDGQQRKIESVLSSGQTILVQVSKDPVGHKGARLTGQVSLPGRFLVYVPDGNTSGISRKLPDTERNRLKAVLKQIVPDSAGVIVRTAAEGASEEELTLDVERLTARWADIEAKVKAGKSPQLLYGEPDLTLKVVRDLFTEDFGKLVVQGDDAWELVQNYVEHVAPDLKDRLERYQPEGNQKDLFTTYRVDEQIAKGLDRKVWLPSGGSLVIDRTEAMTVVDVNTGKFTGSGGNLEETVTKNNLEAAEEMVRQLRLRDIGGIIVIDFIDMVLESNRDLVLRRLVECLGRDRTRHQVAEVTSLGLVQMTRKRIGTGLVEAFGTDCDHCKGRGLVIHDQPVEAGSGPDDDDSRGRGRGRSGRSRSGRGNGNDSGGNAGSGSGDGNGSAATAKPSPADLAKTRPHEKPVEDEPGAEVASSGADRPEQPPAAQPEQPATPTSASVDTEQSVEHGGIGKPTSAAHEPQRVTSESGRTPSEGDQAEAPGDRPTGEKPTGEEPAESPAAPEPPRAVTTTRRRTARRAAGPPSLLSESSPTAGAGTQALPLDEPFEVPVEHAGAVARPDPRVQDETEVSADPTWPTGGIAHLSEKQESDSEGSSDQAESNDADGDAAVDDEHEHGDDGEHEHGDDGELEGENLEGENGDGVSLVHVPVKRKGSRRR